MGYRSPIFSTAGVFCEARNDTCSRSRTSDSLTLKFTLRGGVAETPVRVNPPPKVANGVESREFWVDCWSCASSAWMAVELAWLIPPDATNWLIRSDAPAPSEAINAGLMLNMVNWLGHCVPSCRTRLELIW